MKIAVYCSSSATVAPEQLEAGRAFGRCLGRRGHTLVYGGFHQGVMGALADGAAETGAEIIAVVPSIFDREGFTHAGCTQVVKTPDMSSRKAAMERLADGFAVLPGGIGTFDEFFEVYVLKTLGQLDKPLGILNVAGCYDPLEGLLNASVEGRFLSEKNRAAARFFTDGEQLLDALEAEHKA